MASADVLLDHASGIEYRFVQGGGSAVVVMHGGHMNAHIELGEEVFRNLGHSLFVPSRPGYGRTPIDAGGGRTGFVDAVAQIVSSHGFDHIDAVVGISAGGAAAVDMAAGNPTFVRRLVLESSVSSLNWPDRATRIAGRVVFAPAVEARTWSAVRWLLRRSPKLGLRFLVDPLTRRPTGDVLAELDSSETASLVAMFESMASGRGFQADLDTQLNSSMLGEVTQPTLVIASNNDGSVPVEHALDLHEQISGSELVVTETSSHLMWFGPHSDDVAEAVTTFLTEPE